MRRTLPLVAVLATACIMTPAQAQAQTSGGYVGLGVMSVSTDNARDFAATSFGPSGSGDESANGLKLYGGYRWPSRFGIEAGLYNLGTYEVRDAGAKTDEFEVSALAVSGTYMVPLGTSFDLNLKLGLAFTNVDYTCLSSCGGIFVNTSKSGVAGLLGGGVGWRITPVFSLRADLRAFRRGESLGRRGGSGIRLWRLFSQRAGQLLIAPKRIASNYRHRWIRSGVIREYGCLCDRKKTAPALSAM